MSLLSMHKEFINKLWRRDKQRSQGNYEQSNDHRWYACDMARRRTAFDSIGYSTDDDHPDAPSGLDKTQETPTHQPIKRKPYTDSENDQDTDCGCCGPRRVHVMEDCQDNMTSLEPSCKP